MRLLYARSKREITWSSLRLASARAPAAESSRRAISLALALCGFSCPMSARFFKVIEIAHQHDLRFLEDATEKRVLPAQFGAEVARAVDMRIDFAAQRFLG